MNIAAQENPIQIIETVDEMTDKVYYSSSSTLLVANEEKSKGFRIDFSMKEKSNGDISLSNLIVTLAGLGSCNEDNTMIILFENDTKVKLSSWNKFNCKGTSYFSISRLDSLALSTTPISKIRLTNGRGYKSYTGDLEDKNFFINLFLAIEYRNIK
jgi:hypothetical protein